MPCKTETRSIDGAEYSITQLPPGDGIKVAVKLGKILAPLGSSGKFDEAGIADGLGRALASTTPDEVLALIKSLLVSDAVKRNGKRVDFDVDFAGNLSEMIKAAGAIVEVNFSDFLEGIGAIGRR